MRGSGDILIVSCYELGRQPVAAASALGFLERAGFRPTALDLAVDSLESLDLAGFRLIAISVPMHTALRLGVRAARRIRKRQPEAHLCFYGLYATLNADYLLGGLADSVIGGELEEALVDLAEALDRGLAPETAASVRLAGRPEPPLMKRLAFAPPSRRGLPPAERYARLAVGNEQRPAAAVETSRGCRFHCRHCPIPPVYGGRFFVVPREIVLGDIRALADAGVRHITFADPDFLNGPRHGREIVRAMHAELPQLTFDITTKVELILKHRGLFGELADNGCVFVVSAVESLSNTVLDALAKGHTRDDAFEALRILRQAGIPMRPSLVAFTPWTTLDDYRDVLDWIDGEDLVHHVDAVQLSIRLLVPPGSALADAETMRAHVTGLDRENFSFLWKHPDPRMDRLHREVSATVHEAALTGRDAMETFGRIRDLAYAAGGRTAPPRRGGTLPARAVSAPPRLTEPWFC